MNTKAELKRTAIHEAGHAVLHMALDLGCEGVTIKPNYAKGSAGAATHGGEWGHRATKLGETGDDTETLRTVAEGEFWLRHAVACYAGAEALRQSGDEAWFLGADGDYSHARDAIDRITGDEWTQDLLGLLAKRRCQVLVEHYWPEIQAVAKRLLRSRTIDGKTARRILCESLSARGALIRGW
jgi:ATP-dependent Zn protease